MYPVLKKHLFLSYFSLFRNILRYQPNLIIFMSDSLVLRFLEISRLSFSLQLPDKASYNSYSLFNTPFQIIFLVIMDKFLL